MTNQRRTQSRTNDPYGSVIWILVGVMTLLILGILGLAISRAGLFSGISFLAGSTPTPAESGFLGCQELIDQAMLVSGSNCDNLGPNQICYGNHAVEVELIPNANEKFANAGDVVDIDLIQHLKTTPLDLSKQEWGIAVLNIIANLPRSLPGESVKMVVFGNTTLGNNSQTDVQSFYFFSELGRIYCDKVPFDGLMVTMPDGTGISLMINGSELTLMGNASLRAVQNGNMDVSLYSGSASITANGQTQNFTAGQTVQVPLGGANGTDSVGVPSDPTLLSPQDLNIACSLAGLFCPSATSVPTVNSQGTQATTVPGNTTPLPTVPGSTSEPAATPVPPSNTQPTPQPESTKRIPPGQEKKTPNPDQPIDSPPDGGNGGNGGNGQKP